MNVPSPVIVLNSNVDESIGENIVASGQISKAANEKTIEDDPNISDQNELISAKATKCEALKKFISSQQKPKISFPRTIHNIELPIAQQQTVFDWKQNLCKTMPNIDPSSLMLIRNGKVMMEHESVGVSGGGTKPTYVLFRTNSKANVTITIRNSNGEENSISIPVSMKVSSLKKELFSKKIVSYKPQHQRLIFDGKILKDFSIVGDYLLGAAKSMLSSKKYPLRKIVVHVCETIDPSQEVDIIVKLNEKKSLKLSFEVSKPIGLIVDILHKQYMFPLPQSGMRYVFYLPSQRKGELLKERELDSSKCLLDYGILGSSKCITLEIARSNSSNSSSSSSDMISTSMPPPPLLALPAPFALLNLLVKVAQEAVSSGAGPLDALATVLRSPVVPPLVTPAAGSSSLPLLSPMVIVPVPIVVGKRSIESHGEEDGDGEKRAKNTDKPISTLPSVQKLPVASVSSSSAMFKGLKKGFLSTSGSGGSVLTSATSGASSKQEPGVSAGLFGGMKKGFLAGNNKKSLDKKP